MPRNRLGETPAQSSPLTSNSRINNLRQSALETHKRGAGVGWRGWDAEPARKAASRRAQSQPLREACTEVRERVCFQLLLGCVDHHRRTPNSLELALPPLGAADLGGWLGRKVRARAGAGMGGGCRSLRGACRRAGRGG